MTKSIHKLTTEEQQVEAKKAQEFRDYLEKLSQLVVRIRKPRGENDKPKEKGKFAPGENVFYPLVGADFPPEGGVRVYWEGVDHPTKVFPYKETVEKVDDLKKLMMASVRSLADTVRRNPIKALLMVLFFRKELKKTALNMLQEFAQVLRDVENDPSMYSPAVKEVYRVFSLEDRKERNEIRDIFCHLLDYDDYYRYRFQDAIAKLDKIAIVKTPIKELRRLFDVLSEGEKWENDPSFDVQFVMKPKWQMFKRMTLALYFQRGLLKEIQRFLVNLNMDKIAMDEIDRYHAEKKTSVNWSWLHKDNPK